MLQTDDDDVVRSVVERAEGNPFYAGELVRAVMEQAVDPRDRVALAHALAHLPDTVHAAVLARLDLLPPAEGRLQLGAVMGRAFSAKASPSSADRGRHRRRVLSPAGGARPLAPVR